MTFRQVTQEELENLVASEQESQHESFPVSDTALIRALSVVDRNLLATLLVEEKCDPGAVILKEGEIGDTVYLIRAGRVGVFTGDFSSPAFVGSRGPGEVIGEMALLENRPRSASVIALEKMSLLKIDGEGFQRLLHHSPAASLSIMTSLSARLREAALVRNVNDQIGRELVSQVSTLQTEKQELLELQRVRQETTDLIIHDLRNPLGLMYSGVQMLEMVLPEDVIKANWELFDVIRTSYTRMRRLVDSLLDVARLESGEVPLAIGKTSLTKLLGEAADPAVYSMKQRNIEYQVQIPDLLPDLIVDEDKMVRVLSNLIDNAVKYMPRGGKLTVSAEQADGHLQVAVTDTGPGIPEAERERVFERFTQVSGSGRPRGFGLGLVFCKLTVEAHGGRIWVETGDNGVGCRFAFTIPLSKEAK